MAQPLPLSRFRVLDLTRVRSGPTAVRQFADWGAQVLMIEGKGARPATNIPRTSSDFQNLNRNKRSLELDLKQPDGRDILYRLVRQSDVLFENFRPDVKHRLQIDYETLRAINPGLVYVSVSGFGQDGPYATRPGLDQIVQGMGGLMSVTGLPGQGPVRAGIAVADSAAGIYAALGAMTALLQREATGQGAWVRTSLLQAQIAMLDFQAARWLVEGEVAGQAGNDHPTSTPMGLFPTSDGEINLAASGDAMFRAFCKVAGCERLLDDPRLAPAARRQHRDWINAEISAVTRTRPTDWWIEALNAVGVPCGPVYAIDQVFADPQVRHLRMARPVTHPTLGEIELVGQPIEISGADPVLRTSAPEPGDHTREALAEVGYTSAEIDDFMARGVV